MADTIEDELAKLPLLSWRGITFPLKDLKTSFTQEVVRHKKPDRDGARLEGTGRNEITVSGSALFLNGVVFTRAKYTVPLYPDVHKQVLLACADRSTGTLDHPELGKFEAKVTSFDSTLTSGTRDGANVAISWVEHVEDQAVLGVTSPLATAINTATSLDGSLDVLRAKYAAKFKTLEEFSFEDAMRTIRAASDQASLLSKRGAGQINRVQNQLNRTRAAVESVGDVSVTVARHEIERLQSALYDVKAALGVTRSVAIFAVRAENVTLGSLAKQLKNTMGDLVVLNPQLSKAPIVPNRSSVRYFKAA